MPGHWMRAKVEEDGYPMWLAVGHDHPGCDLFFQQADHLRAWNFKRFPAADLDREDRCPFQKPHTCAWADMIGCVQTERFPMRADGIERNVRLTIPPDYSPSAVLSIDERTELGGG
jgi:hypothetical protein